MCLLAFFYNIFIWFAFILYFPFYIHKQIKRGGLDKAFLERFGLFSKAKKEKIAALKNPIWLHTVSVGETVAGLNFIEFWNKKDPQIQFIISTTTTTGQAIARKKAPKNVVVIYMPLDFRGAIRRAFKIIKPSKLVIFEVEIWPNLLWQAKKNGVETSLINGRMSDKSFRGFMKYKFFFGKIFNIFSNICAQTTEDAKRFSDLCGDSQKVTTCNTMKFDQMPLAKGKIVREEILPYFVTENPFILNIASTHAPEEEFFINNYIDLKMKFPNLALILVPRHVERTSEIEKILKEKKLSYSLFTEKNISKKADILLVNITGELLSLLAISDIVFVGKSLCGNEGGHNIIEPAIFGKVILHGDAMQNFRDVAEIFQKENAAVIVTENDFAKVLSDLIEKPEMRENLEKNALSTVKKYSGSMAKTLEILLK